MATFGDRIRSAWNAFSSNDDEFTNPFSAGSFGYTGIQSIRPSRAPSRLGDGKSIIAAIYTRMSMDISAVSIRHTRHDESDRYKEDMISGLQDCLTVEANVDQAARAFRQDIVLSLFEKGVAAIVAVDTSVDPGISASYDIRSMRVGEVVQWYPAHVRVSVYNELKGIRQDVTLPKRNVAIVENPLYSVMNEPNSTLQRLIRKLALLDSVDEASSSGKLDLIIQLPYVVKSNNRKDQAEKRRSDIEAQLKGSQYGIAYMDGTEKITQLNRPTENNLLKQIEMLTNLLYSQLGITPEVMNGTADEAAMINYNNRTVEPIVASITEELKRTFLTKTARTQGQSIDYFRDPFKLVPMSQMAELGDKLIRNEIVTGNEFRGFLGLKPSTEPKADQLVNPNMPIDQTGVTGVDAPLDTQPVDGEEFINTGDASLAFDDLDDALDEVLINFGIEPPEDDGLVDLPEDGDLDPSVLNDALDDIDELIDQLDQGVE